jgi:hypothetical protein
MSHLVQDWAEEVSVADVYERVLLMSLAQRASPDGTGCYPAVATLARASMSSTRTIQRRLTQLAERGIIRLGDQAKVSYLPAGKRPTVWDLMVPYDWYSAAQMEKVQLWRAENNLPPLRPEDRPPLPPVEPARKRRSDSGKSRPRKRTAETTADQQEGDVTRLLVTPVDSPSDPVDNPQGGVTSSPAGVTSSPELTRLVVTQTRKELTRPVNPSFSTAPVGTVPPTGTEVDARAGEGTTSGHDDERHDLLDVESTRRLQAGALLRSLPMPPAAAPPTLDEKAALVELVLQLWAAGASTVEIRKDLSRDLSGVRYAGRIWITRLGVLLEHVRARAAARAATPPLCGQCEGRPNEGVASRTVWLDDQHERFALCPRCHPAGLQQVVSIGAH